MYIFNKLLETFLLGVICAAIPGPMLTTIFSGVLHGGFKYGLNIILKALIAEVIVIVLVIFLVCSLNIPPIYFRLISYAGAIFLIHLAFKIWGIQHIDGNIHDKLFSFQKLLILTIFNGAFWIFWLTVCVPRAINLNNSIFAGQFVFIIAFEVGWLTTMIFLIYIFSKFRKLLLSKKLISSIFKVFALLLIFFAIKPLIV